jgi:hypothetical protein
MPIQSMHPHACVHSWLSTYAELICRITDVYRSVPPMLIIVIVDLYDALNLHPYASKKMTAQLHNY